MDVVSTARDTLNQGLDLMWTPPLVTALGPDGRRLSIEWVSRCIYRLLPFTEIDDPAAVLQSLDDLRKQDGRSPSKEEIWDRSYELSWPRWYPARIAVCHLYRAWWYSRFDEGWQFAYEQESSLRLMLDGTCHPAEFREAVLEEYERVAAESGVDPKRSGH